MIKSLPEMTPFWAFYFQFPCSKTAVFHGFSLKFTQILHFKPLLNRFETYNIESCFKIWFSIKKNNWKLVSIITFRNRQLGKFWKNHRPHLYQLFIVHTQELPNSIKKTLILIIFSGAENGARPTTLQNKPKTVISIIFSYSKNEKYSIFKFQTHR